MDKPGGGQPAQGKQFLSRRKFLTVAGSAGVAVAATQFPFAKARTAPARFTGYPFTLGVASGDPTPDGVGALDAARAGAARGQRRDAGPGHHGRVGSRQGRGRSRMSSPAARRSPPTATRTRCTPSRRGSSRATSTSTASAPTGRSAPRAVRRRRPRAADALAFAFASCQQYEHGYFTAYKHMAQEDLDLVIHLGDYIYEYDSNSYTASGGNVRANSNHEIVNLADYRERHAQYKTDPDLQAAHAAFPWLVTFDDHEIDNNWAGDIPEEGMPQTSSRAAAGPPSRPTGSTCRCARPQRPTRHGDPDLPARAVRQPGDVPRDGHAPVPLRPGVRGRRQGGLRRPQQPGAHDHRRRAGAVALRRPAGLAGQVADPRPAGLHGPARLRRRRGRDLQHGRLGRLHGLARQAAGLHRHAPDRQPDRDHRRRAPELGRNLLRDFRDAARRSSARSSSAPRSPPPATAATREHGRVRPRTRGSSSTASSAATSAWRWTSSICRTDYRTLPYVKRPGAPITTHKSFVVEAGNPGLKDA